MTLIKVLSMLMVERKSIDVKKLPSQGFFYPPDMKLKIKKAEIEDILEYEQNIDRHNMIKSIDCIKNVVEKNVSLNKNYCYNDLKSVDIIFIFLEIVKFTKSKDLLVKYIDVNGVENKIPFGIEHFNYFDFSPYMSFYDAQTREFILNGWHYSFPCIGVENALARYLSSLTDVEKIDNLKNISYNFLFFLTGKNNMTFSEIENVIEIFNYELEEAEKKIVDDIVSTFSPILSYSLKVDGLKVELKSSMNLELIWQL